MDDFLWVTFDIAICKFYLRLKVLFQLTTAGSTVEPGVALFACGLAALRPLLRQLFPSRFANLNLRSTVTGFSFQPPELSQVEGIISEDVPSTAKQTTKAKKQQMGERHLSRRIKETSVWISNSNGQGTCVSNASREVPIFLDDENINHHNANSSETPA